MADLHNALQTFHEAIKDCQKCALASGRTQVVFGNGNPDADIMFVGEAPGYYEDKEGRPFVGAAGKLLDRLLQEIGLQRSEIFIANVWKCRPPQNRDPLPDEVEACKPYLFRQIELIKPRVICTLGNFATQLRPYQLCEDHGNPLPLICMEDTAVDAFVTSSFGTFVMTLWHGVLSAPSWHNFTSLTSGWAIASGRQTITASLWGSGTAHVKHCSRYDAF